MWQPNWKMTEQESKTPHSNRDTRPTLKYYYYISDTKLDMLYSSIPRNLLNEIAAELRIDVKLWFVDIGTTIKPQPSEETRYERLRVLLQYMEKQPNVGTIDDPQAYFRGSLSMRWGTLITRRYSAGIVLFLSTTTQTSLILTGSEDHLLGAEKKNSHRGNYSMFIDLAHLIEETADEAEKHPLPDPVNTSREATDELTNDLHGFDVLSERVMWWNWPEQKFEFLARKLKYSRANDHPALLVGTPIYVALAD